MQQKYKRKDLLLMLLDYGIQCLWSTLILSGFTVLVKIPLSPDFKLLVLFLPTLELILFHNYNFYILFFLFKFCQPI